jgi:predicted alpha/beta-hydrolase family hydrolase
MTHLRDGLAAAGFPTMTFDYPYAAAGRRSPNRPPVLLACQRAAAFRLADYVTSVVLAGKSMGGRMASHLASGIDPAGGAIEDGYPDPAGLVYYGYPLVPLGKAGPRDVAHLAAITAPQLFFAGTRDRLSPPDLIVPVAASLGSATVDVIPDADHSFQVPKRAGRTWEEVLDHLVSRTVEWLDSLPPR